MSEADMRDYVKRGLRGAAVGSALAVGLSGAPTDNGRDASSGKQGYTVINKTPAQTKKNKSIHLKNKKINTSNTTIGDVDE